MRHGHRGSRRLRGQVRTLIFNRPAKRNALTVAMYATLADELTSAGVSAKVRAAVLTGAGDIFTAGNDIHDFVAQPPVSDDSHVVRFLKALVSFPKPILAAVNGAAIGVGTTMLLHCDLVLAAPSARFQFPFVKLGLCPEGGSSLLLPRMVGLQRASEALLWGEPLDAAAAQRMGFVNEVVGEGELEATVRGGSSGSWTCRRTRLPPRRSSSGHRCDTSSPRRWRGKPTRFRRGWRRERRPRPLRRSWRRGSRGFRRLPLSFRLTHRKSRKQGWEGEANIFMNHPGLLKSRRAWN